MFESVDRHVARRPRACASDERPLQQGAADPTTAELRVGGQLVDPQLLPVVDQECGPDDPAVGTHSDLQLVRGEPLPVGDQGLPRGQRRGRPVGPLAERQLHHLERLDLVGGRGLAHNDPWHVRLSRRTVPLVIQPQDPRRADRHRSGGPEQRDGVGAAVLHRLADPVGTQLPGAVHGPVHQRPAEPEAPVIGVDVGPPRAPAQHQAPRCHRAPGATHDQGVLRPVGLDEVADQVGTLVHLLTGVVELAGAHEGDDIVDVLVGQRARGESRWQDDHRPAAARRSSTRSRRSHVKVEPPADSRPKWP